MNWRFIQVTLNLQYAVYFSFVGTLYCHRSAASQIPGERFGGVVGAVVDTVGPQQCVKECLKRPKLCKAVNYRKSDLLCEMMSEVEGTELNTDYSRIDIPQDFDSQDDCSTCSTCQMNHICVTLTSNQTYCVKDDYDPMDCGSIRDKFPVLSSGKYIVRLRDLGHVTVFCDMETDEGGWTVFQRRMDGSADFYRNWTDYRSGFGNLSFEFWLGNDKLHYLLKQGTYELRMDMGDSFGTTGFVKYSSIKLGNESSNYTIEISGYSGNVGDCFTMGNEGGIHNIQFSTYDVDNDHSSGHCAAVFKAGWWYNDCYCANPNGLYLPENTTTPNLGIRYGYWSTLNKLLKSTTLMVKRV